MNPQLCIVFRDPTSGSIYSCCRVDCRPLSGEKPACINATAWPLLETKGPYLFFFSYTGKRTWAEAHFHSHRCPHQILTEPEGCRARCCLGSFYTFISPQTPPLLKVPFLDVFLPCNSFPHPIPEYSSNNMEGRRARRGQSFLLFLEVDNTFLQGNGTPWGVLLHITSFPN